MRKQVSLYTCRIVCLVASLTCGCDSPGVGSTVPESDAITPVDQTLRYPYKIITTCGMVTDIVRTVVGKKGDVEGLIGETVDPHMYKPLRSDSRKLFNADVVFYSGLMLEGRMSDLFTQIGRKGKPVYAVTEKIDESYLREPLEFQGHWDPHVWMDVMAWSQCVAFIATALSEFDPINASVYKKNANAYQIKLKRLDGYARQVISTIPAQQRWLITAHDAFGYFSRAYNIQVKSVQGITTESEPGVADITDLVDFIVKKKIGAIFVESSVNPKNIRTILEGCRAKRWTVIIGGRLFSDAMGKSGTYEGTYIGMIDHNATIITRALGGEAPQKGLNDKLSEDFSE